MQAKDLAETVRRVAAMFGGARARSQAADLAAVADALASRGTTEIGSIVGAIEAQRKLPALAELAPRDIVTRIEAARRDLTATEQILKELKLASLPRSTAIEVASLFLETTTERFKSKPQAIKAIEDRIKDRQYLDAKDAQNSSVTPW